MTFYRASHHSLFHPSFLYQMYVYVDSKNFEVSKILSKYNMTVTERLIMKNNDYEEMLLIFCYVRRKDMDKFENVILKEASNNLLIKYGQRYKQICESLDEILK